MTVAETSAAVILGEMTARAAALADWYEAWARDAALPLWAGAGREPSGAFHEALFFDGTPDAEAIRRVRVQFRQAYVYAAAELLGLYDGGGALALAALERARERAWARPAAGDGARQAAGDPVPEGAAGWAHLLGPDGSVVDAKRDAYDQAFALFAGAWTWRATSAPFVAELVRDTLAFVDRDLAASSGGWWEAVDASSGGGPELRRQNPHMHALEAMLALYEAFGDRAHLDRARQIYSLFAGRFYDWRAHLVLEYFDLDWRPAPRARQRVEPGHLVEWVYLLREYERLTGESVGAIADPLYDRALEIGRDKSGFFLVDELDMAGAPTKRTRRLWPQTEAAKAALTQYRATGEGRYFKDALRALEGLRDQYLAAQTRGGWRDAFDLDGRLVADRMPASTLYHIFCAAALARDLLRRPPKKRAASGPTAKETAMLEPEAAATPSRVTPVILAGGTGSRLWPLSTPDTPKQFLRLAGARTLFQETLARVADPALFSAPITVASARHAPTIAAQAAEAGVALQRMILEPVARNSAPALAAAAYAAEPDALLLALPADHLIRETALFHGLVEHAAAAARSGAIVTFGVTPTRPETGFGYIRAGAPLGVAGAFEVDAFVEKPDLETARGYVASGSYLWNSGMLLFRAGDMRAELEAHAPAVAAAAREAATKAEIGVEGGFPTLALDEAAFAAAPSTSIDYAVMERTERAAVCPAALTWSDIGSWDALAAADARADAAGNVVDGPAALMACSGVYLRSDGVKIAAIGLENVVVVAAGDTVLIADRAQAQAVREAAARLEAVIGDGKSEGDA